MTKVKVVRFEFGKIIRTEILELEDNLVQGMNEAMEHINANSNSMRVVKKEVDGLLTYEVYK